MSTAAWLRHGPRAHLQCNNSRTRFTFPQMTTLPRQCAAARSSSEATSQARGQNVASQRQSQCFHTAAHLALTPWGRQAVTWKFGTYLTYFPDELPAPTRSSVQGVEASIIPVVWYATICYHSTMVYGNGNVYQLVQQPRDELHPTISTDVHPLYRRVDNLQSMPMCAPMKFLNTSI